MCGQLHCTSSSEKPLLRVRYSQGLDCREIDTNVGSQSVNPGLSPNGAKCGDGKMCIRQKCLSVESLRASGIGVDCPENCNGHGICNNKGHCHCDEGYVPPLCNLPDLNGTATSLNGKID